MREKIKQVIIDDETVYLFTDNPKEDIKEFITAYKNEDEEPEIELGYELPELSKYKFLGTEHECISLWFDNEDIPDTYTNFNSKY